jgi:hypothetical protein
MPLVLADRIKETTTTTGTGTVTLLGAVLGFQAFSVIGNGNTTFYTIAGQGTSEWEVGIGTYTASGTTLSRDTVLASSAGAPTKTNFSGGTKDVFVTYPAGRSVYVEGSNLSTTPVPSGSVMLFVQTNAPTGWTKSTTHDNKALRVVSGTASSGGSVAFTTAFASQAVSGTNSSTTATGTVGATTLATTQIPSHTHTAGNSATVTSAKAGVNYRNTAAGSVATGAAGGGGSHNHSFTGDAHSHTFTGTAINLAVQYVDVIVATKD